MFCSIQKPLFFSVNCRRWSNTPPKKNWNYIESPPHAIGTSIGVITIRFDTKAIKTKRESIGNWCVCDKPHFTSLITIFSWPHRPMSVRTQFYCIRIKLSAVFTVRWSCGFLQLRAFPSLNLFKWYFIFFLFLVALSPQSEWKVMAKNTKNDMAGLEWTLLYNGNSGNSGALTTALIAMIIMAIKLQSIVAKGIANELSDGLKSMLMCC